VGHIVNQAPSKVDLDLVLTGKAAHAGICPEEGIMPSSLRPRHRPPSHRAHRPPDDFECGVDQRRQDPEYGRRTGLR